jgi:hypothetical protein
MGWRRAQLVFALALLAARVAFAADSADPKRYLNDIKTLSAPVMEGRGAGTKGIALAANVIEQRFQSLGLKPAGTKSYFQPFTVITGARLMEGNRFEAGIEILFRITFRPPEKSAAPSYLPDTERPPRNLIMTITPIWM